MLITVRTWKSLSRSEQEQIMRRSETDISSVEEHVSEIIGYVKSRGDAALIELTEKYDKAVLSQDRIKVSEQEIDHAEAALDEEMKETIRYAVENLRTVCSLQKPHPMTFSEVRPGLYVGEKAVPMDSAGIYVPRGRGTFPSMLYMAALPAKTAGVSRVCVITPPDPDGSVDKASLYAARLCGIDEIYRTGGAHGIAALAYGTETIIPVDKIVGPGSMYVTAAKRLVSSIVDTGLPAGPSESIILADETAEPHNIALDLLVESEHGSDSAALLLTSSTELADECAEIIGRLIEELPQPRKQFVTDVFSGYGGIFLTDDMEEAIEFVNQYAPEHLQLVTRDPFQTLSKIRNAGEILLGRYVPFSSANYVTGANAILPTGGKAKTYSAVSVRDFLKYSSVVYASEEAYREMAPHVVRLADYEGFAAHGNACRQRVRS